MNGTRSGKAILTAVFALGLTAGAATAQEGIGDRTTALLNAAREAEEMASRSGNEDARDKAVELHLQVADLAGVDERQAVASLRTAALYLAYTKPQQAARLMEKAAERAAAHGNVVAAAESYLDAASTMARGSYLTAEDFVKISTWISQARDLAESPLLTAGDRDRIIQRAGPAPGQFAG